MQTGATEMQMIMKYLYYHCMGGGEKGNPSLGQSYNQFPCKVCCCIVPPCCQFINTELTSTKLSGCLSKKICCSTITSYCAWCRNHQGKLHGLCCLWDQTRRSQRYLSGLKIYQSTLVRDVNMISFVMLHNLPLHHFILYASWQCIITLA